jgi:hypothetical protein
MEFYEHPASILIEHTQPDGAPVATFILGTRVFRVIGQSAHPASKARRFVKWAVRHALVYDALGVITSQTCR